MTQKENLLDKYSFALNEFIKKYSVKYLKICTMKGNIFEEMIGEPLFCCASVLQKIVEKMPVILHVRDAHEDALRILRWPPDGKLGGVIHCFYGSNEIAKQDLKLGYHIGIGGSVLQLEERAKDLWEATPHIPLDRM